MKDLYIGTYFGIPLYLHFSYFLIYLITAVPVGVSHGLAIGINTGLLITFVFLSVIIHEYAHSLTGRYLGVPVKKITLYVIGGLASFSFIPRGTKEELYITIAGPLSNFFIFSVIGILSISLTGNYQLASGGIEGVATPIYTKSFWVAVGYLNMIIGVFNLIPAFPMDGGRIFRATLSRFMSVKLATYIACGVATVLAVGFFIYSVYNFHIIHALIAGLVFLYASAEAARIQENNHLDVSVPEDTMLKWATRKIDLTDIDEKLENQFRRARIMIDDKRYENEEFVIEYNLNTVKDYIQTDLIPKYFPTPQYSDITFKFKNVSEISKI